MTNSPQNDQSIDDLFGDETTEGQQDRPSLIQRWYELTSLPDAPLNSTFVQREAVRRSRLSSSVIFFFLLLLCSMLPVTLFVINIYPSYVWITLALFILSIVALMFNRRGHTDIAGFIVTIGAFACLTLALFSTVPFDETTLQGYDMYVILLLLSVSLLPVQWVVLFLVLSIGAMIGSLLVMPLTPTLHADVQSRLVLILARPIGTLFTVGGIAWILSAVLTNAIRRANRAETIARLEREQRQFRKNLENDIEQILQTHVQVSNGNLNARAPLSNDNVLWQIARSLNNLLVRFQRAIQAEQQLQSVDQTVTNLVAHIQRQKDKKIQLPLTRNPHLDRLITELQGTQITIPQSPSVPGSSAPFADNRPLGGPRHE
jgi:hypothetical protein